MPLDIEGYDDADDNECHETRPYERMMQTPDQVDEQASAGPSDQPPLVSPRSVAGLPLEVLSMKVPAGVVPVGQKYGHGHYAASSCSTDLLAVPPHRLVSAPLERRGSSGIDVAGLEPPLSPETR